MSQPEPDFTIPARPKANYPPQGGVEYEGETVFSLHPQPEQSDEELGVLVADVLAAERYVFGDWFELPLPVYLVHDRETGDVFRVVVRDGAVELHVLPNTESAGLRAMYAQVVDASDGTWAVDCRSTGES